MAGTLYDYMIATVIVGAIFVAAVVVIPNVSYLNLLYLDQQQLRNVALEALKAMLFDVGYPSNWGTSFDQDDLERFGLAFSDSSSFFVLDPDKVQRLVVDNPLGFLGYEKIRELLELQDYGFSVRIIPPFNVTVNDLSQGNNILFEVSVNFNDKRPIPNANVNAIIVYSQSQGSSYSIHTREVQNVTDELGRSTIEEVLTENFDDLVVVFKTTVADVACVTAVHGEGFQPSVELADVSMVGDNITLTMPSTGDPGPQANRWVYGIISVSEDGLTTLYNGSKSEESKLNYGSFNLWSRSFGGFKESDPVLVIFDIYSVDPSQSPARRQLLMAGPYPYLTGARVIHYGGTSAMGVNAAVNLQRSVIIAGMTYIFELTLWKE